MLYKRAIHGKKPKQQLWRSVDELKTFEKVTDSVRFHTRPDFNCQWSVVTPAGNFLFDSEKTCFY